MRSLILIAAVIGLANGKFSPIFQNNSKHFTVFENVSKALLIVISRTFEFSSQFSIYLEEKKNREMTTGN